MRLDYRTGRFDLRGRFAPADEWEFWDTVECLEALDRLDSDADLDSDDEELIVLDEAIAQLYTNDRDPALRRHSAATRDAAPS